MGLCKSNQIKMASTTNNLITNLTKKLREFSKVPASTYAATGFAEWIFFLVKYYFNKRCLQELNSSLKCLTYNQNSWMLGAQIYDLVEEAFLSVRRNIKEVIKISDDLTQNNFIGASKLHNLIAIKHSFKIKDINKLIRLF